MVSDITSTASFHSVVWFHLFQTQKEFTLNCVISTTTI